LVKSDFENLDRFLSYRANRQTDGRTDTLTIMNTCEKSQVIKYHNILQLKG